MSNSEPDNEKTSDLAKNEKKRWTIEDGLKFNAAKIEAALHSSIPQDQFMCALATVWQNGGSNMHKADFGSFIMACVEAAELGLRPGNILGECYIIAQKDKWRGPGLWASLRIGYRGMMKLSRRGGDVIGMNPETVYANDEFRVTKGTSRAIHHVPWFDPSIAASEPGDVIAGYCTATLRNGEIAFHVVDRIRIDDAARRSGKPWEDKPSAVWDEHEDAMVKKTAIRDFCKYLPIPDDAKHAIVRDEYRDAGIPEYTVSQVSDTDAAIANMRQDPRELERKAGEKATRDAFLEKQKTLGAKMKLIKEGEAGQDFFEAANCNRDTETVRAFIIYANDLDEYPTHIDAEIEATDRAVRYLLRWATEGEDNALNMQGCFDLLINGKPEETPEDRESRNANDAFEAAQG